MVFELLGERNERRTGLGIVDLDVRLRAGAGRGVLQDEDAGLAADVDGHEGQEERASARRGFDRHAGTARPARPGERGDVVGGRELAAEAARSRLVGENGEVVRRDAPAPIVPPVRPAALPSNLANTRMDVVTSPPVSFMTSMTVLP
ncbi:MAG: hypothetical protein IPG72_07890 [Ardenticatenales bacterium]|nr:hypothetical protein [Ardenticatenales bacterium]